MNAHQRRKKKRSLPTGGSEGVFRHKGYRYEVFLHPTLGHRCGYVELPVGHPDWGVDYDGLPYACHGGLTFADAACRCDPMVGLAQEAPVVLTRNGIAKENLYESPWIIGFDCAHLGDAHYGHLAPSMRDTKGVIRSHVYVANECKSLITQIIERHATK